MLDKRDVGRALARAVFLLCLPVLPWPVHAEEPSLPQPVQEIGNALRGVFNFLGDLAQPKVAELKSLVEAKRFGEAADYYLANETELSPSAGAKAELEKAVAGLNASLAMGAPEASARLAALRADQAAEWAQASEALRAARTILANYDAVPLLKRPEHRSASIAELEQAVVGAQARFAAQAREAFASYDHAATPLFFEAYPAEIGRPERDAIAQQESAAWMAALARSPEPHAKLLAAAYSGALEASQRTLLVAAYREMLVRARSLGTPLSAGDAVQLARALQEAGLEEGLQTSGLRLIVLQETAGPPISWSTDELKLAVTQLPLRDLPAFLSEVERTKPAEVLAILDPHRLLLHHGTASVATFSARRLTGYRTEPNPEWEQARMAVDSARQTLSDVQQQNEENQRQAQQLARQSGGSSFYMLGAMAGSGLSTYAVNAAQQEVRSAESKFRSTPQTVRVPEYADYAMPVATIQALKRHEVGVYLVEGASSRFWRGVLREEASQSGEFRLGVHPQDPDRAKADADNRSGRSRLAEFVKGPAPLTASQVWQRLAAEGIVADQPVSALYRTIQADLRAWQLEASEEIARRDSAERAAKAEMARLSGR